MVKKVTIDDLAIMVGKGFAGVDEKFKAVDAKLDAVDARLDAVDARLDSVDTKLETITVKLEEKASKADLLYLETKIDRVIQDSEVHKYEFEDLSARMKYVETKVGIESGK